MSPREESKGAASFVGTAYVAASLMLLANAWLARGLGPTTYGTFAYTYALVTLTTGLLSVPVHDGAVFFALQKRPFVAKETLFSASAAVHALSGGLAIIALLAVGLLLPSSSPSKLEYLLIMSLGVGAACIQPTLTAMLTVSGNLIKDARASLAVAATRLAGFSAAVLLSSLSVAFWTFAVASMVGSVLRYRAVNRTDTQTLRLTKGARGVFRPLLRFGFHGAVASSLVIAVERLPVLILGARTSSTELGYLQVALLPIGLATLLVAPARQWLLPGLTRGVTNNETRLITRIAKWSLVAIAASIALAALLKPLVAPVVVAIFGAPYREAADAATVAIVVATATVSSGLMKTAVLAFGKPQYRTYVGIGTFTVLVAGLVTTAVDAVSTMVVICAAQLSSFSLWWIAVGVLQADRSANHSSHA